MLHAKFQDHRTYGKNLKSLLLQNRKSYDLETWHGALYRRFLKVLPYIGMVASLVM